MPTPISNHASSSTAAERSAPSRSRSSNREESLVSLVKQRGDRISTSRSPSSERYPYGEAQGGKRDRVGQFLADGRIKGGQQEFYISSGQALKLDEINAALKKIRQEPIPPHGHPDDRLAPLGIHMRTLPGDRQDVIDNGNLSTLYVFERGHKWPERLANAPHSDENVVRIRVAPHLTQSQAAPFVRALAQQRSRMGDAPVYAATMRPEGKRADGVPHAAWKNMTIPDPAKRPSFTSNNG